MVGGSAGVVGVWWGAVQCGGGQCSVVGVSAGVAVSWVQVRAGPHPYTPQRAVPGATFSAPKATNSKRMLGIID